MEWWVYLLIGYFTIGFFIAMYNMTRRGLIGGAGPLATILGQMLLWPLFLYWERF